MFETRFGYVFGEIYPKNANYRPNQFQDIPDYQIYQKTAQKKPKAMTDKKKGGGGGEV